MVANCQQKAFLNNDKNKSQFVSLLSKALRHHGHDVRESKGDADTLIVSAALGYATNTKDVTVIADDIDVFVLFMYHWGY